MEENVNVAVIYDDSIVYADAIKLQSYPREQLIFEIERLRESHEERIRSLSTLHKRDIQIIGEAAIELANGHGWCSTYDDFVEDLNCRLSYLLPTRETDFQIYVRFNVHATGTVTAKNAEEARQIWSDNHSWLDLSLNDIYISIDDVEIDDISVEAQ